MGIQYLDTDDCLLNSATSLRIFSSFMMKTLFVALALFLFYVECSLGRPTSEDDRVFGIPDGAFKDAIKAYNADPNNKGKALNFFGRSLPSGERSFNELME